MATKAPTRRELKARADEALFTPPPARQLLAGLGEVVHKRVPLSAITPNPDQPRRLIEEEAQPFRDLVGSIRQQGLIQSIHLWQMDEDEERYTIIAGERRWRAFRRLSEENPTEFSRIPATVTVLRGDDTQAKSLMLALAENVVRQDLNPRDRADALSRLKEMTRVSWKEIADRMGLALVTVQELAALARDDVSSAAVGEKAITQSQGVIVSQALSREPAELRAAVVEAIRGRSRTETRTLVSRLRNTDPGLPAEERIRQALDPIALIEDLPATSTEHTPIRRNGRRIGTLTRTMLDLRRTPLTAIRPQVTQIDREEMARILQAFCEDTGIWPQKPTTKPT